MIMSAVLFFVGLGPAQVTGQSVEIKQTAAGIGVTYLHDGINGMAGMNFTALKLSPDGRLSLNALVVSDWKNSNTRYYTGAMIGYRLTPLNSTGFQANLYAGWKGVDFTNGLGGLEMVKDRPIVFGIGLVFPLKF